MTSQRARLAAAAGLCVLPLGFDWADGSGHRVLAAQAPIRVFLVGAALGFVLCAVRVRTPALLRVARLAWLGAAAAALLAAGHGSTRILLCLVTALTLTASAGAGARIRPRRFG